MKIYLLSIHSEYANMILSGDKKWEFRQNHLFGQDLEVGDCIFVVATYRQQHKSSEIICSCMVDGILRGQEMYDYFCDEASGRWKESGCSENSNRDWSYFEETILGSYSVAVKLTATPTNPPLSTAKFLHKTKHKPWKGIGFTPAGNLHRYTIEGQNVEQYLQALICSG
jgi:hypothetical protein